MKKLLILFLTVGLCLTSVFAFASCGCQKEDTRVNTSTLTEPDIVDSNGFGYIIVDSKTLTLTQYKGSATEVQIPSEYEGKSVTAVGGGAFRNTQISSVTVPDSVTSIGERAFSNCQKLSSVNLPDEIKVIEKNAFEYCPNLKTVKLPSDLETIGMYCFTASGIESIEIPDSVTSIDHYAFYQCLNLKTVKVPASVKEFGMEVFSDDENLTITGPKGSAIEEYAKQNKYKFTAE